MVNVKISYPLASLHEAAKFIWENNSGVTSWPSQPQDVFDVMSNIQETMRKGALKNAELIIAERKTGTINESEWCSYIGTGGYTILYEMNEETEDDITIGIDILVNPGLGHVNPGYVVEFVEELDNEVVDKQTELL